MSPRRTHRNWGDARAVTWGRQLSLALQQLPNDPVVRVSPSWHGLPKPEGLTSAVSFGVCKAVQTSFPSDQQPWEVGGAGVFIFILQMRKGLKEMMGLGWGHVAWPG